MYLQQELNELNASLKVLIVCVKDACTRYPLWLVCRQSLNADIFPNQFKFIVIIIIFSIQEEKWYSTALKEEVDKITKEKVELEQKCSALEKVLY